MTVTTALGRWSKRSNRKRAVETAARAAPWLAAAAAITAFAIERWDIPIGASVGGVLAIAVLVGAVRRQRTVRHRPASIARVLDGQHHTVDLLQTALSIETAQPKDDLDVVVLARAGELVPRLDKVAVAPLKLRASPISGLTALAAGALLFLTGADTRDEDRPVDVATERAKAQSSELAKAVDELAKDPTLSPEARAKLQEAKQALDRAAAAQTGKAALAAMSEAQRLLDEVAPHFDSPKAEALAKMSSKELAEQMANAAKSGDSAKLASLAREALRRSMQSDALAKEMAEALAAAAKKAGTSDPWGESSFANSPEGKRLAALASAAEQMAKGDMDAAKSSLADLAKSMGPPRGDPRASKLASARRMLAAMRAAERSALNGTEMADARAEAMRAAARGAPRPGSGTRPGTGTGSGAGKGMGMGMGMGSGMGSGRGPGMGRGPGTGPGSGPPQAGAGLSVLAPGGTPGGASGSTGSHGGTTPAGAFEPETVMAEDVDAPPPSSLSPEGVIRAIAEHAQGDHRSTQFGPVRDHYAAIAESAIHRDEIPLTRRDFIQRYFEALRNREEP